VVVSEVVTAAPEKCTQQFVLTVAVKPRFHLSQLKEDLFTAETVFQNTENSKFKKMSEFSDFNYYNWKTLKKVFQIHFILADYSVNTLLLISPILC
jgi:hypothetical protein